MENKFTFVIPTTEFTNGTKIEQSFDNEYGKWNIFVSAKSNSFGGFIKLESKFTIPKRFLQKLKILLNFENSYDSNNSIANLSPSYTVQDSHHFHTYSRGLDNGYKNFAIRVEVDASSLPSLSNLTSIVSSGGHLKELYESGKFADITIKTKDNVIKAHNLILSRSKVFDTMLNAHDTKEAQEGVIEVNDIEHEVLVEMIRYLYTDETPMIEDMALDLLLAANKYDVTGLMDECVDYLEENVKIDTFADILITADLLKIPSLKKAAFNFVIANSEAGFESDGWKQLKENNVPLAMEILEKICLKFLKKV